MSSLYAAPPTKESVEQMLIQVQSTEIKLRDAKTTIDKYKALVELQESELSQLNSTLSYRDNTIHELSRLARLLVTFVTQTSQPSSIRDNSILPDTSPLLDALSVIQDARLSEFVGKEELQSILHNVHNAHTSKQSYKTHQSPLAALTDDNFQLLFTQLIAIEKQILNEEELLQKTIASPQIQLLTDQNTTLSSQIATLNDQSTTLLRQNNTLTTQLTALSTQNTTLLSQNDQLMQHNTSLANQVSKLTNQFTTQLNTFTNQLDTQQSIMTSQSATIQALQQQIEALQLERTQTTQTTQPPHPFRPDCDGFPASPPLTRLDDLSTKLTALGELSDQLTGFGEFSSRITDTIEGICEQLDIQDAVLQDILTIGNNQEASLQLVLNRFISQNPSLQSPQNIPTQSSPPQDLLQLPQSLVNKPQQSEESGKRRDNILAEILTTAQSVNVEIQTAATASDHQDLVLQNIVEINNRQDAKLNNLLLHNEQLLTTLNEINLQRSTQSQHGDLNHYSSITIASHIPALSDSPLTLHSLTSNIHAALQAIDSKSDKQLNLLQSLHHTTKNLLSSSPASVAAHNTFNHQQHSSDKANSELKGALVTVMDAIEDIDNRLSEVESQSPSRCSQPDQSHQINVVKDHSTQHSQNTPASTQAPTTPHLTQSRPPRGTNLSEDLDIDGRIMQDMALNQALMQLNLPLPPYGISPPSSINLEPLPPFSHQVCSQPQADPNTTTIDLPTLQAFLETHLTQHTSTLTQHTHTFYEYNANMATVSTQLNKMVEQLSSFVSLIDNQFLTLQQLIGSLTKATANLGGDSAQNQPSNSLQHSTSPTSLSFATSAATTTTTTLSMLHNIYTQMHHIGYLTFGPEIMPMLRGKNWVENHTNFDTIDTSQDAIVFADENVASHLPTDNATTQLTDETKLVSTDLDAIASTLPQIYPDHQNLYSLYIDNSEVLYEMLATVIASQQAHSAQLSQISELSAHPPSHSLPDSHSTAELNQNQHIETIIELLQNIQKSTRTQESNFSTLSDQLKSHQSQFESLTSSLDPNNGEQERLKSIEAQTSQATILKHTTSIQQQFSHLFDVISVLCQKVDQTTEKACSTGQITTQSLPHPAPLSQSDRSTSSTPVDPSADAGNEINNQSTNIQQMALVSQSMTIIVSLLNEIKVLLLDSGSSLRHDKINTDAQTLTDTRQQQLTTLLDSATLQSTFNTLLTESLQKSIPSLIQPTLSPFLSQLQTSITTLLHSLDSLSSHLQPRHRYTTPTKATQKPTNLALTPQLTSTNLNSEPNTPLHTAQTSCALGDMIDSIIHDVQNDESEHDSEPNFTLHHTNLPLSNLPTDQPQQLHDALTTIKTYYKDIQQHLEILTSRLTLDHPLSRHNITSPITNPLDLTRHTNNSYTQSNHNNNLQDSISNQSHHEDADIATSQVLPHQLPHSHSSNESTNHQVVAITQIEDELNNHLFRHNQHSQDVLKQIYAVITNIAQITSTNTETITFSSHTIFKVLQSLQSLSISITSTINDTLHTIHNQLCDRIEETMKTTIQQTVTSTLSLIFSKFSSTFQTTMLSQQRELYETYLGSYGDQLDKLDHNMSVLIHQAMNQSFQPTATVPGHMGSVDQSGDDNDEIASTANITSPSHFNSHQNDQHADKSIPLTSQLMEKSPLPSFLPLATKHGFTRLRSSPTNHYILSSVADPKSPRDQSITNINDTGEKDLNRSLHDSFNQSHVLSFHQGPLPHNLDDVHTHIVEVTDDNADDGKVAPTPVGSINGQPVFLQRALYNPSPLPQLSIQPATQSIINHNHNSADHLRNTHKIAPPGINNDFVNEDQQKQRQRDGNMFNFARYDTSLDDTLDEIAPTAQPHPDSSQTKPTPSSQFQPRPPSQFRKLQPLQPLQPPQFPPSTSHTHSNPQITPAGIHSPHSQPTQRSTHNLLPQIHHPAANHESLESHTQHHDLHRTPTKARQIGQRHGQKQISQLLDTGISPIKSSYPTHASSTDDVLHDAVNFNHRISQNERVPTVHRSPNAQNLSSFRDQSLSQSSMGLNPSPTSSNNFE